MFRRTNRLILNHSRCRLVLLLFPLYVTSCFLFIFYHSQKNISFPSTIILIRTSHYCQARLDYLRQSWIPNDHSQQSNIYLLTDNLLNYNNQTLLHSFDNLIETDCPQTHEPRALCCKTAHEFELFYNLSSRNPNLHWMCRFDDDQYVNLNNLYRFLSQMDRLKAYYIGRRSTDKPSRIPRRSETYRFATYGAGVCFSRPLLDQLRPHVNKTLFPLGCRKMGISDDGYVGYLVEFILNISLSSFNDLFHSHLEKLDQSFRLFSLNYLAQAISFGFAWDRYPLSWLPIIHQLIELIDQGQEHAANNLWLFLQNYERIHPEYLKKQFDRSCHSYNDKY